MPNLRSWTITFWQFEEADWSPSPFLGSHWWGADSGSRRRIRSLALLALLLAAGYLPEPFWAGLWDQNGTSLLTPPSSWKWGHLRLRRQGWPGLPHQSQARAGERPTFLVRERPCPTVGNQEAVGSTFTHPKEGPGSGWQLSPAHVWVVGFLSPVCRQRGALAGETKRLLPYEPCQFLY